MALSLEGGVECPCVSNFLDASVTLNYNHSHNLRHPFSTDNGRAASLLNDEAFTVMV